MRNVLDTGCRENRNTHFMFNIFFFENHAVYKTMSKNMVKPKEPQMMSHTSCMLDKQD